MQFLALKKLCEKMSYQSKWKMKIKHKDFVGIGCCFKAGSLIFFELVDCMHYELLCRAKKNFLKLVHCMHYEHPCRAKKLFKASTLYAL